MGEEIESSSQEIACVVIKGRKSEDVKCGKIESG
jgi:hypothetical protein